MDNLYEKIESLCDRRGISITQMCRDSGVSRAPLSDLKMGRSKTLSSTTISKIASYFEVPADYFFGNTDKKEKASALAEEPTAEAFEQKLYRALVSGGIIPPGGDLTDKQVEILDAIATIIDATFGD